MGESGQASLVVLGGPNSGKTVQLTGNAITMGRRQDNDVIVDEAPVSRRHALIMQTQNGHIVRDLNSTNGTFVNRERLGGADQTLNDGDEINLAGASVTLLFRMEETRTQVISLPEIPAAPAEYLRLDGGTRDIYVNGVRLDPPPEPKEFDMLRYLVDNRGSVVSREDITRNVWPELPDGSIRPQKIDEHVERLQTYLEEDPTQPRHLIAVGEFGYLLDWREEAA